MAISAVKSSSLAQFDQAREGMDRAERRLERSASKIAQGDLDENSILDLIVSERTYQANAVVVRTQDEMIGSLLDVKR